MGYRQALEELEDDLRLRLDFHLKQKENLPSAFKAATSELGCPAKLARKYRRINRSCSWIEGALLLNIWYLGFPCFFKWPMDFFSI